ncbi:hypothetical protein MBLNU13_g03150t1 [Cladosporium sp. NU13]
MASTEVQQLIATSQAEAMGASQTNVCNREPDTETKVAQGRYPPVSTPSEPAQPTATPFQPPQEQVTGLARSQHEHSDEPVRAFQQPNRGLVGSQHEYSELIPSPPRGNRRLAGSQHPRSDRPFQPPRRQAYGQRELRNQAAARPRRRFHGTEQ